jgi:hypothetical protein
MEVLGFLCVPPGSSTVQLHDSPSSNLSRSSKTEYPKSLTDLLRLEEDRFVQGACYFINKIVKLIFKNVQNIYCILLELRDIKKSRGDRYDRSLSNCAKGDLMGIPKDFLYIHGKVRGHAVA